MKKGFTLIELLAVIIILSIIALIATPMVIGVIDNARVEAAKNSAYGVVDAAKLYYTESLIDSTKVVGDTNQVTDLVVSGTAPTSGTWSYSNGKITLTDVVIGDYTCNGDNSSKTSMTCEKTPAA